MTKKVRRDKAGHSAEVATSISTIPITVTEQSSTYDSRHLEMLMREYDQLKEEIRGALDIYEKVYGSLIVVVGVISALLAASQQLSNDARGPFFIGLSALIFGILAIVFYGHEVALARLSARLEVVEYRISILLGHIGFLDWQSRWSNIGRGKWQKLLAALAMLPSVAIYVYAAFESKSWLATKFSLSPLAAFLIQCAFMLGFIVIHEFCYMRKLQHQLAVEKEKSKQEAVNASVNNRSNARVQPSSG